MIKLRLLSYFRLYVFRFEGVIYMNKNMQKTALTTSAVLAGIVLGVNVNQNGVHADTTTNAATTAATDTNQQLANLKSQQTANESAVASSNAATMSAATTSGNSQIADLNDQIKERQASAATAQQNKIDQVNKDAQAANSAYSSAVAKQKTANDAELKDAQAKATAEQQKSINQENTDFKNKSNSLNTEHNQNLKQIGNNYQDQSQEINQKIADAKKTDQQHYNQVIENATKQVDNQINNATTAVNQAKKTVNDDQTDIQNKQSANDQAQSAAKAATDTLNSDQTALSAAKKQAQDAILPQFPQYVDISQDYIDGLPQVHDQQSADALEAKDPEHSNFFRNSYQSDPYAANEPIDVTNLTSDQLLQINLYSTRLINQIREQFNQPALTLNSEGIENAQWIANQAAQRKSYNHEWDLLSGTNGENLMGLVTTNDDKAIQLSKRKSTDFSLNKDDMLVFKYSSIKTMDDLQAEVFYSIMTMFFSDNGTGNQYGHAKNFIHNKGQMALGVETFQAVNNPNHENVYLRWIFTNENSFESENNIDTATKPSLTRSTESKTFTRQIILQIPNGNQSKSQNITLTRKVLTDNNTGQITTGIWQGTIPPYQAPQLNNYDLTNPNAGNQIITIENTNPEAEIKPITFIYENKWQSPDQTTYHKADQNDYYKFTTNIQYVLPDGKIAGTSKVTINGYRFKDGTHYGKYDDQHSTIQTSGISLKAVSMPQLVAHSNQPGFLEYKLKLTCDLKHLQLSVPNYKFKNQPTIEVTYYVYDTNTMALNGMSVGTQNIKFDLVPAEQPKPETPTNLPKQYININYQTASGQVIAVDHLVGKPGNTTAVTLHIPDGYELTDSNQPTSFTYQFKSNQPDILISVKGGNGKDQATISKPENAAKKLQDQIRQLAAKVDSDIQTATDAQNKAKATATDLKNAQDKLTSDSDNLSQAQAKLDDLKANRDKAIKDIAGEPTESPIIKKLQNQLTDLEKDQNKAIETENAQYEAKVSDLKANHEAKLKAIAAQPANLADLQSQLQAKLDTLKANHDAKLKQINDDANAKITTIKSQKVNDPEIDKLQAQIDQIKSDLTKKQQELDNQYQSLKAKDQAEYNALAEKLKNSSSETAKGNNDHYTTDDGSATVKLPDKKNDSDKSESDNKSVTNVNNAAAGLFEIGKNKANSHKRSIVSELNNSISRGTLTSTTAATSNSHAHVSSADASTSTPTTREEVKQQAKLPQTGNSNSLALLALGAIASMFGFGLITKKRY